MRAIERERRRSSDVSWLLSCNGAGCGARRDVDKSSLELTGICSICTRFSLVLVIVYQVEGNVFWFDDSAPKDPRCECVGNNVTVDFRNRNLLHSKDMHHKEKAEVGALDPFSSALLPTTSLLLLQLLRSQECPLVDPPKTIKYDLQIGPPPSAPPSNYLSRPWRKSQQIPLLSHGVDKRKTWWLKRNIRNTISFRIWITHGTW